MVAQSVSSPASAAAHAATELEYVDADPWNNEVEYRSRSASRPGMYNRTFMNVITGTVRCNCAACVCGRPCWHAAHIAATWCSHPDRILAARYNADQLLAAAKKAKNLIKVYHARCWRTLPADRLTLVACRDEYHRRQEALVALDAADDTAA